MAVSMPRPRAPNRAKAHRIHSHPPALEKLIMAKGNEDDDGKKEALDRTLKELEKEYGKGTIMTLGDQRANVDIPSIPTGSLSLDIALGVGGIPRGRVVEIYGPEASGKTTLALHIIANAQKAGGLAAFIDAEHALDPEYAQALGVDIENLLINQPDSGEQALDVVESLVRSNALDVVAVDSVAALVPRTEIDGEMGDQTVGEQARLMSRALRKLAAIISKSRTSVLFLNQVRMKIGVMFGNPETTPGGRALKFYSSVRLEIRRISSLKHRGDNIGNRCRVKVAKNKVAPPFRKAEFDLIFGEGISYEGDLLDLGEEHGIIEKAGAWYSYGEERLGQGRENAREFLKENPDIADEIEVKILDEAAPRLAEKRREEMGVAEEAEDEQDTDEDDE